MQLHPLRRLAVLRVGGAGGGRPGDQHLQVPETAVADGAALLATQLGAEGGDGLLGQVIDDR